MCLLYYFDFDTNTKLLIKNILEVRKAKNWTVSFRETAIMSNNKYLFTEIVWFFMSSLNCKKKIKL